MAVTSECTIGSLVAGDDRPLILIGGPCVLETRDINMQVGVTLREKCAELGLVYVLKARFDKANRSVIH